VEIMPPAGNLGMHFGKTVLDRHRFTRRLDGRFVGEGRTDCKRNDHAKRPAAPFGRAGCAGFLMLGKVKGGPANAVRVPNGGNAPAPSDPWVWQGPV